MRQTKSATEVFKGQKLTLLCWQLCAFHYERMPKLHLFPSKILFYITAVSFPLCIFELTTMMLGVILVILGISPYALGKPIFIINP